MDVSRMRCKPNTTWLSGKMNKLLLPLLLRAPVAVHFETLGGQSLSGYRTVRRFAKEAKQSQAAPANVEVGLTADHVNKVYCLPAEVIKSCFPQGLPNQLSTQTAVLGSLCWLLRENSWKMIDGLKSVHVGSGRRFLLYGPDGTGKTTIMLQAIQQCLQDGWLVLHIPNVFSWNHSKSELKSSLQSTQFDTPNEASKWLHNFRAVNSRSLSKIKLSQDYVLTKKETLTCGEELGKTVDKGIMKSHLATAMFRVVLEEAAVLAESNKVLIAVDSFNGCFSPTSYLNEDKTRVKPQQLNLVKYLLEFMDPVKFKGSVITALSQKDLMHCSKKDTSYERLLGSEGSDLAHSFELLHIDNYTRDEMETCVDHFVRDKWITKSLESAAIKELWYLSAGNPYELHKLCASL